MRAVLLLLFAATAASFAQQPGTATITVFREQAKGYFSRQARQFKMYSGKSFDEPPTARMRWTVYLDGKKSASIGSGEFVSYRLPAGRHELLTGNAERMEFDLAPGSQTFLRLEVHQKVYSIMPHQRASIATCSAAAAAIEQSDMHQPKTKRIYFGEVLPGDFPHCQ